MTQRLLRLILLLSLTMIGGLLWPLDSAPALLALHSGIDRLTGASSAIHR